MIGFTLERDMAYVSCPSRIIHAPVDVVWALLTHPEGWGNFYDLRIGSVEPPGAASVGQVILGESGPPIFHLKVRFDFFKIDPINYELGFDVRMPLNIKVREQMNCVPVDEQRCRVNYHCAFEFPDGWRGIVLRRVLRRELDAGPADSLARLQRAAEQRHATRSKPNRSRRPFTPGGAAD